MAQVLWYITQKILLHFWRLCNRIVLEPDYLALELDLPPDAISEGRYLRSHETRPYKFKQALLFTCDLDHRRLL